MLPDRLRAKGSSVDGICAQARWSPTAMRTASSSSQSPKDRTGRAFSRAPDFFDWAATSLAWGLGWTAVLSSSSCVACMRFVPNFIILLHRGWGRWWVGADGLAATHCTPPRCRGVRSVHYNLSEGIWLERSFAPSRWGKLSLNSPLHAQTSWSRRSGLFLGRGIVQADSCWSFSNV